MTIRIRSQILVNKMSFLTRVTWPVLDDTLIRKGLREVAALPQRKEPVEVVRESDQEDFHTPPGGIYFEHVPVRGDPRAGGGRDYICWLSGEHLRVTLEDLVGRGRSGDLCDPG